MKFRLASKLRKEQQQQQHLFNHFSLQKIIMHAFLLEKLLQLVVMATRNNHRVKNAKWPFA